jgi:hypothetical protein
LCAGADFVCAFIDNYWRLANASNAKHIMLFDSYELGNKNEPNAKGFSSFGLKMIYDTNVGFGYGSLSDFEKN